MAVIRIDLDDQASASLETLQDQLKQTEKATDGLGDSSASLTDEQKHQSDMILKLADALLSASTAAESLGDMTDRQHEIVNRSTMDWKSFGAVVVPALAAVEVESIKLTEKMVDVAYAGEKFAYETGAKVVDSLLRMAEQTVKYTLLTKGAVSVIGAFRGQANGAAGVTGQFASQMSYLNRVMLAGSVAMLTTTEEFGLLEAAAIRAGKVAFNAFTGLGPVIAGVTIGVKGYQAVLANTGKRSLGWVDDLSQQTEEQAERWQELTAKAKELGKSVDELAASMGIMNIQAEFGVQRYEKFETNLDRFSEALDGLKGDLGGVATAFKDNAVWFAGEAWEKGKEAVSELVPEIQALKTVSVAAWKEIDRAATASTDQAVENITILRDYLNGGTRELEAYHQRMDQLREREAAGFQAIRNVNKQLEDDKVAAAKAEEERARAEQISSIQTIAGIEQEIIKIRERAAEQARAGQDATKIEKDMLTELRAVEEQRTEIIKGETDKRKQMAKEYRDFMAEVAKYEADQAKKTADERWKADEEVLAKIRDARKKAAQQEIDDEANAEKAKQRFREESMADAEVRLAKELADQHKAAAEAVKIEMDKQAALKKAREQVAEKAGIKGEDLLQNAKPDDVRKNLIDQARKDAQEKTRLANQDLLQKSDFDPSALTEYKRRQQQAQQQAVKQANRDFARGTTDPTKLIEAQQKAAQGQINALGQNGKLSQETVQTLTVVLNTQAQASAQTQALQRAVEKLQREAVALNNRASQERQRAQANSQ